MKLFFTTFTFDRAISAGELASYAKEESKLVFEIGKRQLIRSLKCLEKMMFLS